MAKEIWKQVPGYRNYEASTLGRIRSLKFNKIRILSFRTNTVGYPIVTFSENGYTKTFSVSYLILKTFIGERPEGKEVSHLNDISTDDRLENLKWETWIENHLRMIINKTKKLKFTNEEKTNLKILCKQLFRQLDE